MEQKKKLVLVTLAAAFFIFICMTIYEVSRAPDQIKTQTAGFLAVGKESAKIELILIEDFRCRNCIAFSLNILPKIESEYLSTGKIRFTIVPVSFLAGSKAIANAAIEVYRQKPDFFLGYLKDVMMQAQEGDIQTADLMRLARRMNGLDLAKLYHCIEQGCHNKELEENLEWARSTMGSKFKTPSLFINGEAGSTFSFEAVKYQIDQTLQMVAKQTPTQNRYAAENDAIENEKKL